VFLLPAEDAESYEVDDYQPCRHDTELGANIPEVLAFGGDEAGTVDYGRERQEAGDVLQPVGHQEAWEESAAQEQPPMAKPMPRITMMLNAKNKASSK
jgi:hypothetical protein